MTMVRTEGIGDVLLIEINNPPINAGSGQTGLTLGQMDVIELIEAFAAKCLSVLRLLGRTDDDVCVNAWGGAITLGHPLGAYGARLATTAITRLHHSGGRYALCTMFIGVGQGIAPILERDLTLEHTP